MKTKIPFTIILFLLSCLAFTFTAPAIISRPTTVDLFASINGTTQNGGGSILKFTPPGPVDAALVGRSNLYCNYPRRLVKEKRA